jgi:hypothetical protein
VIATAVSKPIICTLLYIKMQDQNFKCIPVLVTTVSMYPHDLLESGTYSHKL